MSNIRVPQEIRRRVEAEIHRCIALAEKAYGITFRFPGLKYDLRGTTAGTASDQKYQIRLQPELMLNHLDSFIEGRDSTVAHEFAHLVDGIVNPWTRESKGYVRTRSGYRRTKRSLHGPTWKRIMMIFGCDPNSRCHEYDTSTVSRRKAGTIIVRCSCGCGKQGPMGAKRAAKWRKDPSQYGYHKRGNKMIPLVEVKEEFSIAASKPKKAPKRGTKKARAIRVYREMMAYPSLGEKEAIIDRIALECDMSKQGATTYYYIAKKEV